MVNDRLTIRDVPFVLWLFLLFFAVLPPVFYFYNFPGMNLQGVLILIYTGFMLIAMMAVSVLTITADRSMAELTLDYRSVLRHSVKIIPFYDILSIDVIRRRSTSDGGSSSTYQVLINTRSKGAVSLRSYGSSGAGSKVRLARQLREFIGVGGQDQTTLNMLNTAREMVKSQLKEVSLPDVSAASPFTRSGAQGKILQGQMSSGITMTRWTSEDFRTGGIFLFMAQNPPKQAFGGGAGLLASLGEVIFRQALKLYGFDDTDAPGADQAQIMSLNDVNPLLAQDFTALSNQTDAAFQYLTPRTIQTLLEWSQKHPLHSIQAAGDGQMVVLIGPKGVSLSVIGGASPDLPQELNRIGAVLMHELH